MEFNAKDIEKRLRRKKKGKVQLRYLKKHPEVRKKHRRKNYYKYREKRLEYAKEYREKNKDKFKKYNDSYVKATTSIYFTLKKNDEEIVVPMSQLINRLKKGWIVKSFDWSKII